MGAPRFPVVELEGSPRERGYRYGSRCKGLIRLSLEALKQTLGDGYDAGMRLSRRYLPYAEDYAPDLVEECRGIAEGSGSTFDQIFLLNCDMDVGLALSEEVETPFPRSIGCVAFAASGSSTLDGETLVSWNGEYYEHWTKTGVLVHVKPDNLVFWNFAGVMGAAWREHRSGPGGQRLPPPEAYTGCTLLLHLQEDP